MRRAVMALCLAVSTGLAGEPPIAALPAGGPPTAALRGSLQDPPLPDAAPFVAQALAKLRSNDMLRSSYSFVETETKYGRDRLGRVAPTHVRVYEVRGSPEPDLTYRRLVSDNGVRPADLASHDAEQRRKEQEWSARRAREGMSAREARLRRQPEAEREERAVIDELTTIFEYRTTGRETIDGRPAIVFTFEPRPGSSPRTPLGRIIRSFRGRAWVDEREHELVRMTSEALDTISVRWGFIVRLLKGSRGYIERRKVDGETWLPTYNRFTGSARVFFIMRVDVDQATKYTGYRRNDTGG
jgi:hypothetical protein